MPKPGKPAVDTSRLNQIDAYTYDEYDRSTIPPVGLARYDTVASPKTPYYYERLLATKKEGRESVENEIQKTEPKMEPDYIYVRYFEENIKQADDNPTIGIVLCSEKNDVMVKYSVLSDNKNLFASKYMLYLPTEEELKKELERERKLIEEEIRNRHRRRRRPFQMHLRQTLHRRRQNNRNGNAYRLANLQQGFLSPG
jgi:hypothetical protein